MRAAINHPRSQPPPAMPQATAKPARPPRSPAGEKKEAVTDEQSSSTPPPWSQVWQMPALIIGLLLFTLGAVLAVMDRKGPDFPALLDEAAAYLKAGNIQEAQTRLQALSPSVLAQATKPNQARHAMLTGDLLFLGQHAQGWSSPENNRKIVAQYLQAQEMGQVIDDGHLQRWAQALVSLGKTQAALAKVDAMSATEARNRYGVIRRIIEQQLTADQGVIDLEAIEPLRLRFLKEIEAERDLAAARAQRIFAVALKARLQLAAQQDDAVIDYLVVREIPRLQMTGPTTAGGTAGGDEDLASLYVLLAQAYERLGRIEEAKRYYLLTDAKVQVDEPDAATMHAQVLVGLGRLSLAQTTATTALTEADQQPVQEALAHFTKASSDYPTTPVYWDALLGVADCEARLGMEVESLEHFTLASKKLTETTAPGVGPGAARFTGPQGEQLIAIIQRHQTARQEISDYQQARQYLLTLAPLFESEWKPEVLSALALATAALADQKIALADGAEADLLAKLENPTPTQTEQARLAAQAAGKRLKMEAAALFDEAGDLFVRHANLLTIAQPEPYADSLWRGADAYDKAHQWKKSVEVLGYLVRNMPGEPRQVQAIYRLGMAHMADGEYPTAELLFRQLIDDHPKSPSAYIGYVPLARCQIALGKYDDAKRALGYVVTNHPALTPQSIEYQQALVELGRLHYDLKEYPLAIERLTEAVTRYGDGADGGTLRFLLADSYRQSVQGLTDDLAKATTTAQKAALIAERNRRLEEAQVLYSQVITQLEAKPASALGKIETLYHRNAYFYRGDCAYDLARFGQTGRFEQAISLYDMAARRFDDEPASLIALVQMVNAYCELNRIPEARAINTRAQQHLKRIPAGAFDDPSLPLNRQHWEEWLRFTSQHKLFDAQASASP